MCASVRLDTIDRAITDIAAGRAVVVLDAADRENEGDLVFAAAASTPKLMGLMIRYTSGIVCAPTDDETLNRLAIPMMTADNHDRMGTAFTVSVDALHGITTGISAFDRSETVRTLSDPNAEPGHLVRPGHVFPLRARRGGVLERAGHTEAAVDLMKLAGQPPVGVIGELVNDDGTVQRGIQCRKFADEHGLALISIEDLIAYRKRRDSWVRHVATTRMPTAYGDFTAYGYRDLITGTEHLTLVKGALGESDSVLTRLHSECLTGDVFGSNRCDCGEQLHDSLRRIADVGRGVLIYLKGHEGRGIGLIDKLRAYEQQDGGLDTVDANLKLGLPVDSRDYTAGAQILNHLGVRKIQLLTNNPDKVRSLAESGILVEERLPLLPTPTAHNFPYLTTKRTRMGHHLPEFTNAPETEKRSALPVDRLPHAVGDC
ncbi:bifunctional 3,4-dihydroxy-2-butanone 4-phosphate synthase/GTP cyclohydrolase II [Rhodococcus erythropolis]|uniref:bifunctional 3,4-dihydroxy-2-butanone-4-phosphate synthase/GTP cyclohydrolase II n=1 Tax=Rhodococcus erythropolis TaxID=1833 RepID=UPI0009FC28FD|nr:bifunctional 3,4-dihydroxy-2-butanone-4-phosphate synthase/GTP cyclohydrolase II [Rhodococcus erythropolis]ORI30979.1 bifunctional 3,4-dihydroxy-2-butanone 4-phosphate synthase/GTP cyclohydrolase II [Rhodococcus erythropolis]